MIENLILGLSMVFQFDNLFWAFVGVTIGMALGATPGLTDTMGMSLLIPFTFFLEPIAGIAMLMGLSKGGNFGGSVPAILFNLPGTPQAAITAIDGYPLAKQGKSGKALKITLYSSVIADISSDLVLMLFAAPVAYLAIRIGPPEYTAIIFFSIAIICSVSSDNFLKGMIAIGIGLLLTIVGSDPATGRVRFIFGNEHLVGGFSIIPLVIGLLIVSEVFNQAFRGLQQKIKIHSEADLGSVNHDRLSLKEFKRCLKPIANAIGIGSVLGALPGIGAVPAAYMSYGRAKSISKHKEEFGKGSIEGIAASEAGNNAVVGPNLIPLITLGIPGNLAAALILGAFMVKGMVPGPLFMQEQGPMLYALFTVLIISNFFNLIVGWIFIKYIKYLRQIPKIYMYPAVILFAIVGSYSYQNDWFDIIVMICFGLLGFILNKFAIPTPPILVAFILGKMFEERMRQSLIISRGSLLIFFKSPIALFFIILSLFAIIYIGFGNQIKKIVVEHNK